MVQVFSLVNRMSMSQWTRVVRSLVSLSVPSSLAGLGIWSQILSLSAFRPNSGSALWITVKLVLGSGMAFMNLNESFRSDLRPQDGYPVVHLCECSGSITCQLEEVSHHFCSIIPAFIHIQVWVKPHLHMVLYLDALLQVLTSPFDNWSQHCRYTGILQVICKFKWNFFNVWNHVLVLLLTIHMDKLPEDLSLPYRPSCTLTLRHAASAWYSQPTLLNLKKNSTLDVEESCTLQPYPDWNPTLL